MKYIKIGLLALSLLTVNTVQANVVGADTHNFNPLVNGIDFVTVKSSETLDAGYINLGAFIDYSVNSLPTYNQTVGGVLQTVEPDDSLLHLDLHAALGLTNWWDIGINIANVVSQTTEQELQNGFFADKGLTDVMLYTKIRFLGNDKGGAALALSVNLPQTKNSPFLGLNSPAPSDDYNQDPIINIELAVDKDFGKWSAGANVGYRMRNPGKNKSSIGIFNESSADDDEVTLNPVGEQILASAALAYKMTDKTRIIGEYFTSFLAGDPENVGGTSSGTSSTEEQLSKTFTTGELLLGLRHDIKPNLHLHAGASTALQEGTSSPDYRVYGGVNYRFGKLWGGAVAAAAVPVEEIVEEVIEEPYVEEPVIEEPIVQEPIAPAQPIIADANDTNVFGNAPSQKVEIYSFRNLNFRTNSAKIPSEFRARLSELTQYVNQSPVFQRLIVHGHTDSRGSSQYNAALSQRRADMVRRALTQVYGLPAEKLSSIGHGEDQPIADNETPDGLLSNRRVEFEIFR